ncbi:hypothetical protein RHABOEDO_000754 [Candidatus Rhabdochlamydia oedothoracis]|uniref:Uncharacterized protein n=1 Tax=Candidatus Rhabdochlamydia oedothoracis TaxID=2720720 RepID=A0ABX8V040_9BACT|nr:MULTISPECIES: hypothetical protein [Rhabdochlamydia]KAG6558605.1 hypothetical protein RHOW815_001405 [Candidatus Rhabdochlamydia sp. W815]MCL6756214.1 hypothetical protein [Candidatus Rhabdochlamydia oedothoracis]QYF48570.1 hypothetical protein RHABOEDO_000754 [Candidatus Rhabdochlamydia oedothoracis]
MKNILDTIMDTTSSSVSAKGFLRGHLAFERWYFYYHNKLSPQQTAKDPSIQIFCRLWAVASAIESFAKVIIVGLSALYYVCQKNDAETEKRLDVLCQQGNSLYYSFIALYSPEEALKDFSVYNAEDPAQSLTRIKWFGYSLRKHSWGNGYNGKTTLEMLINTH